MSVARTVLVSISSITREVDVVADADVALSELLAPVAGLLGLRAADIAVTVTRSSDPAQAFTMRLTETLGEAGVVDGDRLSLHPFSQAPGPVVQVMWMEEEL
ncbi:MAG TPA: EsaB/YukD family protein [Acidimicrobiales bacterium]|nr:EsaB/YukD family protein [Acidimicrobiales bacterium]